MIVNLMAVSKYDLAVDNGIFPYWSSADVRLCRKRPDRSRLGTNTSHMKIVAPVEGSNKSYTPVIHNHT